MAKPDFHHWCHLVRTKFPGSDAARFMDLAEAEMARHHVVAEASMRPTSKYHCSRSFEDCVGGMKQVGKEGYDFFDDFTVHVLNRANTFFIWGTIMEGCERYGRTWVKTAPSIDVNSPTPRTPQEWKWGQGPNRMLQTPANKEAHHRGLVLQLRQPGAYVIEMPRGRGKSKHMELLLTVRTHLGDAGFRQYVHSLSGKADVMRKVQAGGGMKGMTITVPTVATAVVALVAPAMSLAIP